MSVIRSARRIRTRLATAFAAATLAILAALALAAAGAFAGGSHTVNGEVVDQVVTDGSCTAILCTRGVYKGTIRGTFEFTITSLGTTDLPNVQSFVGHSTIHTAKGDLRCADSGSFNADPQSTGEGVHLCVIAGGTGRYADATGYLQERLHFAGTEGRGIYTGEVNR
jgi:hypothetical protein